MANQYSPRSKNRFLTKSPIKALDLYQASKAPKRSTSSSRSTRSHPPLNPLPSVSVDSRGGLPTRIE